MTIDDVGPHGQQQATATHWFELESQFPDLCSSARVLLQCNWYCIPVYLPAVSVSYPPSHCELAGSSRRSVRTVCAQLRRKPHVVVGNIAYGATLPSGCRMAGSSVDEEGCCCFHYQCPHIVWDVMLWPSLATGKGVETYWAHDYVSCVLHSLQHGPMASHQ